MDHQVGMPQKHAIPKSALVLGWLGVLPFALFSLVAVATRSQVAGHAATALVLYGMIILSFMGGAQWGLAMRAPDEAPAALARRLGISVLPALGAFALGALPPRPALLGLALLFAALLAYDLSTVRAGAAPAWYGKLRMQLTAAVVLCLLTACVFGAA